jgi:hypothetical protein
LALSLALASPAPAHLGLRYPPSRYGDYVLKIGPCGSAGGQRSDHVTVLEPGASIEVVWDEYVNHPGHFRISFDDDGDDDFVDPKCLSGCNTRAPQIESDSNPAVLLDHIADTPSGGEGRAMVTLPDIECERCTLQVIQVMYDKPPYVIPGDDIYYQCADLVLRRAASPTPTASASPTPTPTAAPTRRASPTGTATAPHAAPTPTPSVTPALPRCVGDCAQPGTVNLDDVVSGVAMALLRPGVSACLASFDVSQDDAVTVDELVDAVNGLLAGCTAL